VHFVTNGYDYYFYHEQEALLPLKGEKKRAKKEKDKDKDIKGSKKEKAVQEEDEKEGSSSLALKTCAIIAVMDYFNCQTKGEDAEDGPKKKKIKQKKQAEKRDKGGEVFRKNCATEVMEQPPEARDTSEWAIEHLQKQVLNKMRKGGISPTLPLPPSCTYYSLTYF
jgi:hypothetical protein